ncbi:MAG: ribonuclease HII [Candidatus Paceibacterota bacterium]|jgi:ribonuclease HII
MKRASWTIGIDEVGRGALAGPVTVSAFAISDVTYLKKNPHPPLRDSKQLTPRQREAWVGYVHIWKKKCPHELFFAIESMSSKIVDKLNVAQAANYAATKALEKVLAHSEIKRGSTEVILDGGLYLKRKMKPPLKRIRTVIKGDEKFDAVKLASIVAKVARDAKLVKLHAVHPHYNFARHKGYGTKIHLEAIRIHGISIVHRLTFVRKFITIQEICHD